MQIVHALAVVLLGGVEDVGSRSARSPSAPSA